MGCVAWASLDPISTPAVSFFDVHSLTQFGYMCGNFTLLSLGSGRELVEIELKEISRIYFGVGCLALQAMDPTQQQMMQQMMMQQLTSQNEASIFAHYVELHAI